MSAAATLGARAALELELLDAQLDHKRLTNRAAALLKEAGQWESSAPLPGHTALTNNARAAHCRLSAFLLDPDIKAAALKVRNVESRLKSAPAQVAPLVTAEMCAGQDDMMNFRAEAA